MTQRKPRKDAARNREAVLAAADDLFASSGSSDDITMAGVAAAAGVGKGTLFRAFDDRAGLLRALYGARLEPLGAAVEAGPPPLGPTTPPHRRIPALLDAVLCFKLDNRRLALALEEEGSTNVYREPHYMQWHSILRAILEEIPDFPDCSLAAHIMLSAVRADLVEHMIEVENISRETLRTQLADFTTRILTIPEPSQ